MSKIWWLYVPVTVFFIQVILEWVFDAPTLSRMHSEGGPHEIIQFLVIGAAFLVASSALAMPAVRRNKGLLAWFGIAAACSLYVAGEEMSWGQHILSWDTPEYWAAVNDQQETNLHNTSAWLDQKPRLLLEIGVIVGGFVIPLLRRIRLAWLPARFAAIYPPASLSVTAGIFLALKIVDAIADAAHIRLFERVSEVQELYLFYFVLLYVVGLRHKIAAGAA